MEHIFSAIKQFIIQLQMRYFVVAIIFVFIMFVLLLFLFLPFFDNLNAAQEEENCTQTYDKFTIERNQLIVDYLINHNHTDGKTIASSIILRSNTYKLDPLLEVARMTVENNTFNPKLRGKAGEYGLMQIHPCWVNNALINHYSAIDLQTIDLNIDAGMRIFQYGNTEGNYLAALGHYNTGSGRNSIYEQKVNKVYMQLIAELYWRLSGTREVQK